jgi:Undecaprenyl-phosphate glucose phosphotransferase
MALGAVETIHHRGGLEEAIYGWMRRVNKQKIIGIVLVIDLVLILASGAASAGFFLAPPERKSFVVASDLLATCGLTVYFLQRFWAYTIPAFGALVRQMRALLGALLAAFVTVTGVMFLLGIDVMPYRLWLLGWMLSILILLPLFRLVLARIIATAEMRGDLARRAVIVGGGKTCEDLIARLERSGGKSIRILGLFDDRDDDRSPGKVGRFSKIGAFSELEAYVRDNYVDLLIVALPATAEERILGLVKKLWELPIDVRIAAHTSRLKLSKRAYTYIGDVPFLAVFDRPLSDWNAAMKSVFDRVVALLALVALSPVMLATALAVKLTSNGPIFFRQVRHGFNNELIRVFKFRSMYVELSDYGGVKQVTKNDPRVTPVGRFIRKSSIDELPQLFNVLLGDLSLVGPRPHAIKSLAGNRLYQEVVDGYYARHRMKPGITGWAQINGWRGETDTAEKIERRVEFDLHYIENWSLGMDIYILIMTPISLFNTKNAY